MKHYFTSRCAEWSFFKGKPPALLDELAKHLTITTKKADEEVFIDKVRQLWWRVIYLPSRQRASLCRHALCLDAASPTACATPAHITSNVLMYGVNCVLCRTLLRPCSSYCPAR